MRGHTRHIRLNRKQTSSKPLPFREHPPLSK